MKTRDDVVVSALLAVAGAGWLSSAGCGNVWKNLTKERDGNVSVQFVNETLYRAGFSWGAYDKWDRSPGPAVLEQDTIGPQSTLAPTSISCLRNLAVGTADFVDRVVQTGADEDLATFNPDIFSTQVSFSDAPQDSDAALLPTVGTAEGVEVRLGVDYSCGDLLIFTLVEDPDAPGGFRVDFELSQDVDPADFRG